MHFDACCRVRGGFRVVEQSGEPDGLIHTIFEGTIEIQQLVIARALSGLCIE
jgi:alkylation response protein AidB-like acyl-CoA dehydrogenase